MRTAGAYQMWYQSEVKPTKYWIFHHISHYNDSDCLFRIKVFVEYLQCHVDIRQGNRGRLQIG